NLFCSLSRIRSGFSLKSFISSIIVHYSNFFILFDIKYENNLKSNIFQNFLVVSVLEQNDFTEIFQ
ncbi:MAG: hypothetical protein ACFFD1_14225, partial [Candidatus Thorarchaeota archaeon]